MQTVKSLFMRRLLWVSGKQDFRYVVTTEKHFRQRDKQNAHKQNACPQVTPATACSHKNRRGFVKPVF